MRALVLNSSPRRNGNSAMLANAVTEGLSLAGHEVQMIHVEDAVSAFLRDCRQCRRADGECSIQDGFRAVFLDSFLPADGFIAATPVYWYGMSAEDNAPKVRQQRLGRTDSRLPLDTYTHIDSAHDRRFAAWVGETLLRQEEEEVTYVN